MKITVAIVASLIIQGISVSCSSAQDSLGAKHLWFIKSGSVALLPSKNEYHEVWQPAGVSRDFTVTPIATFSYFAQAGYQRRIFREAYVQASVSCKRVALSYVDRGWSVGESGYRYDGEIMSAERNWFVAVDAGIAYNIRFLKKYRIVNYILLNADFLVHYYHRVTYDPEKANFRNFQVKGWNDRLQVPDVNVIYQLGISVPFKTVQIQPVIALPVFYVNNLFNRNQQLTDPRRPYHAEFSIGLTVLFNGSTKNRAK